MKKAFFTIEGEEKFQGITSGQRWNGFECPYFDLETAQKILSTLQDVDQAKEFGFSYYHFNDDFSLLFETHEDGTEQYSPITFEGVKYYSIGFCNWVWQLAIEEEEEEG